MQTGAFQNCACGAQARTQIKSRVVDGRQEHYAVCLGCDAEWVNDRGRWIGPIKPTAASEEPGGVKPEADIPEQAPPPAEPAPSVAPDQLAEAMLDTLTERLAAKADQPTAQFIRNARDQVLKPPESKGAQPEQPAQAPAETSDGATYTFNDLLWQEYSALRQAGSQVVGPVEGMGRLQLAMQELWRWPGLRGEESDVCAGRLLAQLAAACQLAAEDCGWVQRETEEGSDGVTG